MALLLVLVAEARACRAQAQGAQSQHCSRHNRAMSWEHTLACLISRTMASASLGLSMRSSWLQAQLTSNSCTGTRGSPCPGPHVREGQQLQAVGSRFV
jgi:hypothetical protein